MRYKAFLSVLSIAALTAAAGSAVAAQVSFSQRPDMGQGTDYASMHRVNGPVVVDDFIVDEATIVGFRWWGSYFQNDPLLPPPPTRNVQFEISLHPDCPANVPLSAKCQGDPRGASPTSYAYSTPGQPYQFLIAVATESLFGVTAGGERVYEYFAQVNTSGVAFQSQIAWVDIAWAAGQFGTDPLADVWGWHESASHFQDFAVQTDRIANAQIPGLGGNPHLGPWNLLQGHDMAFEVITVPEPATLALLGLGLAGLGFSRRKQ